MKEKELRTLKFFVSFKKAVLRKFFILHCDADFITFLSECVTNILNGNVVIRKKTIMKYYNEMRILSDPKIPMSNRREILSSDKGLHLIQDMSRAVFNHFKLS